MDAHPLLSMVIWMYWVWNNIHAVTLYSSYLVYFAYHSQAIIKVYPPSSLYSSKKLHPLSMPPDSPPPLHSNCLRKQFIEILFCSVIFTRKHSRLCQPGKREMTVTAEQHRNRPFSPACPRQPSCQTELVPLACTVPYSSKSFPSMSMSNCYF